MGFLFCLVYERLILDKFTQLFALTILGIKAMLITVLYNTVIFGGE